MSESTPAPREITDPRAWDRAVLAMPEPHILQSWAWGETKAQTGWRARRLSWEEQAPVPESPALTAEARAATPRATGRTGSTERATATAWAVGAMLVRRLNQALPLAVAYVPKGPLLDWSDEALRLRVIRDLEREARRSRCIFVKIDPDIPLGSPEGTAVVELLQQRGWTPSGEQIQYRNTMISDLTPDEAELLAAMKPKWRYNIRLAERSGVVVRDGDVSDLPAFYAMYAETGRRDGFLVRPFEYYRAIWERFLAGGLAHVLLAEVDRPLADRPGSVQPVAEQPDADRPASGQPKAAQPVAARPVAGLILFRLGPTAWYFYGASTGQHRDLMPNHALQWAAMRWAKAHGCTRYDWWGAPDVLEESDPMWGVYRFKQGFGGKFTPHMGAWDFPVNKGLYWVYTQAMPKVLDVMRRRGGQAAGGAPTGENA